MKPYLDWLLHQKGPAYAVDHAVSHAITKGAAKHETSRLKRQVSPFKATASDPRPDPPPLILLEQPQQAEHPKLTCMPRNSNLAQRTLSQFVRCQGEETFCFTRCMRCTYHHIHLYGYVHTTCFQHAPQINRGPSGSVP